MHLMNMKLEQKEELGSTQSLGIQKLCISIVEIQVYDDKNKY